MLNLKEATEIAHKFLPSGKIEAVIEYEDLFIFQIFLTRPGETGYDPFFSVDRNTEEFRDFSIITDGDTAKINDLFVKAKAGR